MKLKDCPAGIASLNKKQQRSTRHIQRDLNRIKAAVAKLKPGPKIPPEAQALIDELLNITHELNAKLGRELKSLKSAIGVCDIGSGFENDLHDDR